MDAYKGKARRAKVRLIAAAVATTTVVAGLVVAAVSGSGSGTSTSAEESPDPQPSPSNSASSPQREYTPATAPAVQITDPRTVKDGIGIGFEHSGLGVVSAGVTYWEDLAFLNADIARKQLERIVSKDSPQSVDERVSQVRATREEVGLPPSGGVPAGLNFTTDVTAVLPRTLDDNGDVVAVWMQYDRYASLPDQPADTDPLTDQTVRLILTWEGGKDGDWKLTDEPQWVKKVQGPRTYHPDSTWAFKAGWRRVADD